MLLNTRPDDLAAELSAELKALGVASVHLPLLAIERQSVSPEAALAQDCALVLCVSPRAAEFFLESLSEQQLQAFKLKQLIAVGARTAQVLREAGLKVLVPEQISSEGLLAMPQLAALKAGDSILILRGQGGRRLIDEVMSARGVLVNELILYRRCTPANLPERYEKLQSANITQVLITSYESWLQFQKLEPNLSRYRYLVLGERLVKLMLNDKALSAGSDTGARAKLNCHIITDLSSSTIAKAYQTWI